MRECVREWVSAWVRAWVSNNNNNNDHHHYNHNFFLTLIVIIDVWSWRCGQEGKTLNFVSYFVLNFVLTYDSLQRIRWLFVSHPLYFSFPVFLNTNLCRVCRNQIWSLLLKRSYLRYLYSALKSISLIFCLLLEFTVRLVKMTQEIGTVEAVEGLLDVSAYPIGSHLKIIPYHVSAISSFKSVSVTAPTNPTPLEEKRFSSGVGGYGFTLANKCTPSSLLMRFGRDCPFFFLLPLASQSSCLRAPRVHRYSNIKVLSFCLRMSSLDVDGYVSTAYR